MIDISKAIINLRPDSKWTLDGETYEDITWIDVQSVPTKEEMDAEVARLQAEYDSQEYARLRKIEYDKLNQDEMRYDDLKNGTTTWEDAIDAIKLAIPKP